jgi:RimJ/RimL family protein N-acetyltransferase
MDYAFVQLGCCRLTARTRRSNKPMRRMLPKMGFMYEGTMRRFYGPTRADDAFCYGMYPANAIRWLT